MTDTKHTPYSPASEQEQLAAPVIEQKMRSLTANEIMKVVGGPQVENNPSNN